VVSAIFLDRDGVLTQDLGLVTEPESLHVLPGVPEALSALRARGLRLICASNQAVVARGLISEDEVEAINGHLDELIVAAGGPALDAHYFCPHHPEAALSRYRVACDCRKPKPGLLHRAAREHGLDLAASFMVGDRLTDIAAGASAGCSTVLVHSGRHRDEPIVTVGPPPTAVKPGFVAAALPEAVGWILAEVDG
jgi:D-glycero-D-manno-heptose 1,7-bisphosphate phosphatase